MIEAVLFDMDGLLIDSEPFWQRAEIEVFETVGIELSVPMCLETRGRRLDEVVEHWFARSPWRSPSRREIAEAIVARVTALVSEQGTARPGVAHAIEFFARRGLPLAVASSSNYSIIEAALSRLAIRERFAAIHSGESERFGKPHPAIFLGAAHKLARACREFCVREPYDPRFRGRRSVWQSVQRKVRSIRLCSTSFWLGRILQPS